MMKIVSVSKLTLAIVSLSMTASLQALNISNVPLFLEQGADPNVIFDLDDSGSMDWTITGREHWNYCAYGLNLNGNCGIQRNSGDFFQALNHRQRLQSGSWVDDGSRWATSPYYVLAADNNLYGNDCNNTMQSCFWNNGSQRRVARFEWRHLSSALNVTYYNPSLSYTPWVGFSDANFEDVTTNPYSSQHVNLSSMVSPDGLDNGFVFHVWFDSHGYSGSQPDRNDRSSGANGDIDLWDEHDRYLVTASSITKNRITYSSSGGNLTRNVGPTITISDANPDQVFNELGEEVIRTPSEIRQNIANWYQYNRRRMFVAKGAVGKVIDEFKDFRYAIRSINNTFSRNLPLANVTDYVGHNQALLDALYPWPQPAQGTPLRTGLARAGNYLNSGGGTNRNVISSACQQSFTVLFTDGYYNGSSPNVGDVDGDGYSNRLSDVARFYAVSDLSTLVNQTPNSVPIPEEPAGLDENRQRMVTFTAAFGIKGDLNNSAGGDWPDTNSNTGANFTPAVAANWSDFNRDAGKIDDMWHAAYNSAGKHISAASPAELVAGLSEVFADISRRTASSTTVAASSGQFNTDTFLYTATFNSDNWIGDVKSFAITGAQLGNLSISETPTWSAAERLDAMNLANREVLSYNPVTRKGIAFTFPSQYPPSSSPGQMSAEQMQILSPGLSLGGNTAAEISQGQDLVDWLRGDNNAGSYRTRLSRLADIVNSSAVYVSAPNSLYPNDIESAPYSEFANAHKNRQSMIYIGANDGMLHAFDASNGDEVFAYVPSLLYQKMANFAVNNDNHQYFVDATPSVGDVYINGQWRTVLVGGLGAGGQAVYALDITTPNLTETNAEQKVLWEFSDQQDEHLGYTYSEPQIVKLANGEWAAVFANGFSALENDGQASSTAKAYIYMVAMDDGSLIKRIEIPAGSVSQENGMASVSIADVNGDHVADYIYAGDLLGNLWRVDIEGDNPSSWGLSFGGRALFKTQSGQPITVQPVLGANITGSGVLIYFGTGRYLEAGDASPNDATTQSFYAIWDDLRSSSASTYPIQLNQLVQQSIIQEFDQANGGNFDVRTSTQNPINWSVHKGWYINLALNNQNDGELVANAYRAQVLGARVLFKSIVPDANECNSGGYSWTYELNAYSGGRLPRSPIDITGDGLINSNDSINGVAGSGFKGDLGALPKVLSHPSSMEVKVSTTTSGDFELLTESSSTVQGRRSWRQLR